MRFNGAIGLHVGNVHRYSASHGCVRVPEEACAILFEKLAVGSEVIVK
ncbi:MAG: L,D-transpeptidase family protein [Lachnospiraceae bacterium]|nr:L,D-transpeptidase family protein [Lachnospiraceae bacterium]